MNCEDCKHEGQKCDQDRFNEEINMKRNYGPQCSIPCFNFTPKTLIENLQKPLTTDEIIKLDIRLAIENLEFVINNQKQLLKAIKIALQNQPDNRPALEKMLLDCVTAVQEIKEKETNLLIKQAETGK